MSTEGKLRIPLLQVGIEIMSRGSVKRVAGGTCLIGLSPDCAGLENKFYYGVDFRFVFLIFTNSFTAAE